MNLQQAEVDNSVLLILYEYEEANARGHRLTADQIAIRLFGRVGHERILMSLEHHAREGLAESGGHWGRVAGYKITRAGAEQIERRERTGATGAPVSQAKFDLAVLYKLHQHAETGGGAITPADLLRLFDIHVSTRRVELALKALEAKQDVERTHHDFSGEGGFWQISRDGMLTVDRAIRLPATFIGRLHVNGDAWLETNEAKQAVLKKLTRDGGGELSPPLGRKLAAPPPSESSVFSRSLDRVHAVNWTTWTAIATIVAAGAAIFALFQVG